MKSLQYLSQALLALLAYTEAAALPEPAPLPEPQAGAASGVCTANLLYRVLLPLSTNAAALAFCTSRFPVTASTTATSTAVSTVTTTTTTIVREYKRQATGTAAVAVAASRTTPALLATLQSFAANVARTACSCIAKPVTTVTTTSLTTTTTTIATAATTQGSCSSGGRTGARACSCSYNLMCQKTLTFGNAQSPNAGVQILVPAANVQECINLCDQYSDCWGVAYDPNRASCNFYSTQWTFTLYDDTLFNRAVAVRNSCTCEGPVVPR